MVFDNLEVDWLGQRRRARVFLSNAAGAPAFLIEAPDYFPRGQVYGFSDDPFLFAFSRPPALPYPAPRPLPAQPGLRLPGRPVPLPLLQPRRTRAPGKPRARARRR